MAKKVSNEDLYKKMVQIEKLLKIATETTEKRIQDFKNKKFNNIFEWKQSVWENCPHKKGVMKEREINFLCKQGNKHCSFEHCPMNLK